MTLATFLFLIQKTSQPDLHVDWNDPAEIPVNNVEISEGIHDGEFVEPKQEVIAIQEKIETLNSHEFQRINGAFKNLMTEAVVSENASGFIDRLTPEQRMSFDKIIDPENKKIILLGKAGTGISFLSI